MKATCTTGLLDKLNAEREALKDKVFDVLGQLFDQRALRELLMEAIRYGSDPDVRARVNRVVDDAVDRDHLRRLLELRALVNDSMDLSKVQAIREDMERAHARRLQPNYIQAFFTEAFQRLGGTHVPAGAWSVRDHARAVVHPGA